MDSMARLKVLVTAPRALSVIDRYEKELGEAGCDVLVRIPLEHLEEQELFPLVRDIDGIICGDDRITGRVLNVASRLRVISKWGTGIDSIDVEDAKRRGIVVCNTPGAFSDPVADTVLGYILLFTRKLDQMAKDMRVGLWQRLPLISLRECTLGIVGLGDIGCAVARRAAAFGIRMLGCTREGPPKANIDDLKVEIVSLETLLAESDFVTLHADMRADNYHLINAKRLGLMRKTSILINTARGPLVDEEALSEALQEGRIAGAALDVFEQEPLPATSPLRNLRMFTLHPTTLTPVHQLLNACTRKAFGTFYKYSVRSTSDDQAYA